MADDGRGHRVGPHTADVVIEAWGPTREVCLEEAVAALVAVFAAIHSGNPPLATGEARFRIEAAADEEQAVLVLEEVLGCLDGEGVVPVAARLERNDDGSLVGMFTTVDAGTVEVIGPIPKGISYSGLEVTRSGSGWRCLATVDV